MILMAVGLPAFLRAYRAYELSNAATQVADILRLTRYEAIRLNHTVQCVIGPASTAGYTNVWVDSDNDNTLDTTKEKMILLGDSGNLVSAPSTAPPISAAVGSLAITSPSPTSSNIRFDARGAVTPPTTANVFYLRSAVAPDAGYRAVVLMPAGSIQIWTSDASGSNWQQQR